MDCNRIIECFKDICNWFKNKYYVDEECKVCGRKNK